MHAIERLRYVARTGDGDPSELAAEAAAALAGLTTDRRALVLACQRLVEHHRSCGPLWWVCARALAASDLRSEMRSVLHALEGDPTLEELFALPTTGQVVVGEATRTIVRALCERPDLEVRLVGDAWSLRWAVRFFSDFRSPPACYEPEEANQALQGAHLALYEPHAAGAQGVLAGEAARSLATAPTGAVRAAVLGTGRLLSTELFAAMVRGLSDPEVGLSDGDDRSIAGLAPKEVPLRRLREGVVLVPAADVDSAVTARGVRPGRAALHANPGVSHVDCPFAPELLTLAAHRA